jgi:hypothetical protein
MVVCGNKKEILIDSQVASNPHMIELAVLAH